MKYDIKGAIITSAIVVVVIYALEYGISLIGGNPFEAPSSSILIAAMVGANVGRLRRTKKEDTES